MFVYRSCECVSVCHCNAVKCVLNSNAEDSHYPSLLSITLHSWRLHLPPSPPPVHLFSTPFLPWSTYFLFSLPALPISSTLHIQSILFSTLQFPYPLFPFMHLFWIPLFCHLTIAVEITSSRKIYHRCKWVWVLAVSVTALWQKH